MAISSPSPPSFSASFFCTRTKSPPVSARFPSISLTHSPRIRTHNVTRRFHVSARLNSSKPSDPGGSVSPDNGNFEYELFHCLSSQHNRGSPVYVTLPIDSVDNSGQLRRRKTLTQSFRAIAMTGVEGVVMEVWWGLVERDHPRVYNWKAYLEIVTMARRCGLKVRVVMAFHQCGTDPSRGGRTWGRGGSVAPLLLARVFQFPISNFARVLCWLLVFQLALCLPGDAIAACCPVHSAPVSPRGQPTSNEAKQRVSAATSNEPTTHSTRQRLTTQRLTPPASRLLVGSSIVRDLKRTLIFFFNFVIQQIVTAVIHVNLMASQLLVSISASRPRSRRFLERLIGLPLCSTITNFRFHQQ